MTETAKKSTYLDKDTFLAWRKEASSKKALGIWTPVSILWSRIEKSEFIREHFIQLPFESKILICSFIGLEVPVKSIEAYFEILMKLHEKHPKTKWLEIHTDDEKLAKSLLKTYRPASDDWVKTTEDFQAFQKEVSGPDAYRWNMISQSILMLRNIYGDAKMIEVMEFWMQNTVTWYLHDLMMVIEEWDKYKEFPADWVMMVLGVAQSQNRMS